MRLFIIEIDFRFDMHQLRKTTASSNHSIEDEESDFEEEEESEPEFSPPLLQPIGEDQGPVGVEPAWTVRLSSTRLSQHAFAVVSSNIWPGAHAIANST